VAGGVDTGDEVSERRLIVPGKTKGLLVALVLE